MFVLDLDREVSASPYFVPHSLQRNLADGDSWVVSGTLGDGWYEGEIALETGFCSRITFADEWFAPSLLKDFLNRYGREEIHRALIRALDSSAFGAAGALSPPPRGYRTTV